jgi:CDP-glycerol glycerophosphotransferase (TagB/SpsB family)
VPQQGSGFTFAAGNARKLFAIPLFALGALASIATPRRADLWVFGSGSGLGEGALALHDYARGRGRELVWLAGSSSELAAARARGMTAELRDSRRGFALTLRAGLVAVTHGFGDVNRFATRGAFAVQLWHGIPLKRIQLDSDVTFSGRFPRLLRWGYRRRSAAIDLVPAASELSAARLRTAFGLPAERVVVTGDPRDDVLATTTPASAREALGLDGFTVLYAPTWRDGDEDPTVPSEAEWDAIDAWLRDRGATLVVRPHPHSVGEYAAGVARCERVRMLDSTVLVDVTPALPAFDALVTDYSSIAFDFALTGGAIAFLAPDAESYAKSRGLYEPYENFSGGLEVSTWAELLERLENLEPLRAHAARLAERHFAYRDGRNTARVYEEITARFHGTRLHGKTEGTRMNPTSMASISALGVQVDASGVTLTGDLGDGVPATASLVGSRATLTAPVSVDGGIWSATIPLHTARWGGPELPAPSGAYLLTLATDDGAVVPATLPTLETLVPQVARVAIDGTVVTLSAPLTDTELGSANQARLEADYRARSVSPSNAVFFESFYGQNASCNPRAIDAAVARLHPGTTRYWSVADASVAVPDGAVPIIEGSEEWWRVRAEARLLVVNDWLRKRWKKRAHQTVLQTWHGTMLKKIAIDRPRHGLRSTIAAVLESRRWDVLLSQNPHSSRIFRSAYRYRGPIWEEGYPRDDALAAGDGASVRAKLGIPSSKKVVLYAPTWRDDRLEHIDHLDVAAFTEALGPDYVTLIRGHSRTLRPGRDVLAGNVIDVTGYPDVTDLFLAADALVTDYSSVMFDFSVTGKPMYFFAPDLEHYRESLRGFYFDLIEVAPGPVVRTAGELVERVLAGDAGAYADKYAAWRGRFNPMDDGQAAERVVARLEKLGAL